MTTPTPSFAPKPAESGSEKDGLIHGLDAAEVQLLGASCNDAKATAYCPYSLFRVGASLLLHQPTDPNSSTPALITGANVENASYPVGTCAERVAMGTAVMAGHRLGSFKAVGVTTDMEDFCSPCGMCRQFLREFLGGETPIFMFDKNGKFIVRTMEELLPLSFGPSSLPPREELREVVGEGKDKKA